MAENSSRNAAIKPDYPRWFLANITAWGVAMGLAAALITFTGLYLNEFTYPRSQPHLDSDLYLGIFWGVILVSIWGMGMLAYWLRQRFYGLPLNRSNFILAGLGGYLAMIPIAIASLVTLFVLEFTSASPYFYLSEPYDIIATESLVLVIVAPVIGALMALLRLGLAIH